MRSTRIVAIASALAGSTIAPVVIAAPKTEACSTAFVEAQKARKTGALLRAREALVTCGQNSCPQVIRDKCVDWLPQVETEIPTIIPVAKDADGSDLGDVEVRIDGSSEARKIDGQALPLDPGEHELEFVRGDERRTVRVVLVARQKDRVVEAKFDSPKAEAPKAPPPAPKAEKKGLPVSVYVLGGVGVVALGGFAYFGLTAIRDKNDLGETCAPGCSEDQKKDVDRKLLFADISLGVAVLSLGAATWIALSSTGGSGEVAVQTAPVRGGARAAVRVSF